MQQAKISGKRATEKDNEMQLGLFDEVEKINALQVFRMEIRFGNRKEIQKILDKIDLILCGHTHGGQVVLPIIGPVYTPSVYGVQYAGGIFEHKGLLMHVSRGVGAKDLLRWNCCPEITLLELELGPEI